jgi:hypothetical protein
MREHNKSRLESLTVVGGTRLPGQRGGSGVCGLFLEFSFGVCQVMLQGACRHITGHIGGAHPSKA